MESIERSEIDVLSQDANNVAEEIFEISVSQTVTCRLQPFEVIHKSHIRYDKRILKSEEGE